MVYASGTTREINRIYPENSGSQPGCPEPDLPAIFIVEDEIVFAEDLKEILEGHGYFVCGNVPTGEEALRLIPEKMPDLVLIDIVLAGTMNGIELAGAIRTLADIPVIFLTSNIDDATIASAKCTRPYGYIPKPFDERALFSTIEIALSKHQADRKIRESENRYRTFVENIQGIAYRYDRKNVLEFFHGAVEKISGYSPADFMEGRRAWTDSIHKDDRKGAMFPGEDDDPVFLKSRSREYRIVRKDGEIRWIHDQTRIIQSKNSSGSLFEGLIYDITPLKTLETDLKKACDIRTAILLMSGHFFRQMLKKNPYGSGSGQQALVSSLSEIIGGIGYEMGAPVVSLYRRTMSPDGLPLISEILRCVHPKLVPPVDPVSDQDLPYTKYGFARWDQQLLRGYPVYGTVSRLSEPEQKFFEGRSVTSVVAIPVFCEDQFWGFLQGLYFNDPHDWTDYEISSLQIAADVIATIIECSGSPGDPFRPLDAQSGSNEDASRTPDTLMDAAVDMVFVADSEGKILHMNRTGLDFFRTDREPNRNEASYTVFADFIKETIHQSPVTSPLPPEDLPVELELTIEGRSVFLDLMLSPVPGSRAERSLFMGIARDVTRQKILRKKQHDIQKKLLLMQKIFRHDLNNQITAILGYLSLCKQETDNPASLGFIQKEERIVESIKKSMSFTKTYENLGDESAVWIDIPEIFSAAWSGLAPESVSLDLPPDPLEILVDPLFRNVVFNLLDNSLSHGGENLSAIRVSVMRSDEEILLLYEDNGTGILSENKEKIVNRGFYTHNGFGLLLSREILSLTGLTIRETGIPGRGACFEITVPKGMWRFREQKE